MLIPVLPIYLREIGLSYQTLTAVLAAAGLGGLIGQVPMGAVIARVGERRVLIVAPLLLAASTALLGVTSVALALASFRIAAGLGNAGWSLAYGAFISTSVAADVRGRASSTFGGVQRIAWLVGPIAGGFVAARFGFDTAFAVTGLVMATGIVPLLSSQVKEIMPVPEPREDHPPLRDIYRRNRGPLVAAGAVSIFVAAAREGRVVVIPLLGAALGLDLADVGILVAVGAASDMLLFPLAGWLMDRFTRLAASVPALTLLAIGLFVAAAATSPAILVLGAAIAGLGNGIGAGIMLTLGADIAPPADASRFLSLLGLAREAGWVMGPLAVGFVADRAGLAAGAVVVSFFALVAVALLVGVLGDTRQAQSWIAPS